MHKKLGIIAGGGAIPQDLINFCKENKRDYFVIAIEGNADKALIDDSIPHAWIRIGQAGTGFKKLAEEKVEEVIMIGTIKRPTLKDLVPDMRTAAFFAKVGMKSLGDDGILRALVKEIEGEGMTVRGIHEVLPELLIKKRRVGQGQAVETGKRRYSPGGGSCNGTGAAGCRSGGSRAARTGARCGRN